MKKFTLFLFFFFLISQLSSLNTLFAQAPYKFNYQAVARNGSAVLESETINVKFEVLQGSPSGSLAWTETHFDVTTSSLGLISLEVGAVVDLIVDWTDGPYYLDVELDLIDGSGFRDFGNAQLLSVPYAMFAEAANGPWSVDGLLGDTLLFPGSVAIGPGMPNGSKLAVQGDDLITENALFEVKRQDGQTVFAVYNEGIRVFVEEGTGKGSKGGFAIGGFTPGKGLTNDYFMVSPDSIRVYIDQTQTAKGSKGGFAIGGFTPGKGDTENLMYLGLDNYFIGHQAGLNNTTGLYNQFFGYQAGMANTTGRDNIFIGNQSGFSNQEGNYNSFIGYRSGYNNTADYNVFIGHRSGFTNTTGHYNAFVGYLSGENNNDGTYNSFFGYRTGRYNTDGDWNAFFGFQAGYNNTTGANNSFFGPNSGFYNTIGNNNTFLGYYAGFLSKTGTDNTYIGSNAGRSGTDASGSENVYIGVSSGHSNTSGSNNIFVGKEAGRSNETGNYNTFLGYQSGYTLTGSSYNTCIGYKTGYAFTSVQGQTLIGYEAGTRVTERCNTFIGSGAGNYATDAQYNVAIGQLAGGGNTSGVVYNTGDYNVFVGSRAGYKNGVGGNNVYLGYEAGREKTGSNNVFIGYRAGSQETGSSKLYIENSNATSPLIYGDFSTNQLRFNANVGIGRAPSSLYGLYVDGGTSYEMRVVGDAHASGNFYSDSDERLKKNINNYENALEKILQIRGVSYEWRKTEFPEMDYDEGIQVGVIAQEVEKVFPEIVSNDGEYKSVAYSKLSAILVEAIKEQQKQIEELKTENAELAAKINNTSKLEAELAELKAMVEQISQQQTLYTQKEDQE